MDTTAEETNDLSQEEMETSEIANEVESSEQQEQASDGEKIEKLQEEVNVHKDKYLRLFAEFENFRKRNARERVELIQTAGKEVITSLLEVLDDCDRAEKQMNTTDDVQQIKEGVQLVFNKLRSTLQAKGLKPMESINTDFDVEKHEAVTEIEVPDKAKKGKVVDEITRGYYLNDKLIRFAKVVVAK
jgi:molecular chaperone GrpE